ncbi:mandelate racemase [Edaphobacter acidisoli]|uniref:Mandelate racemase n=1 Tax=Edaphobacter acidisoli TaxID=2040573 RepID=A0A916S2A2_9BACT|nr:enolase C-terminal domain-like protein [Edaphobacter acidisoli]GGA80612.1 mandelate racemase [Edaphobacter acidisoli]
MLMEAKLQKAHVFVYTVPTDAPEADGTFSWDSTTMVLVHLEGGGKRALGYTYADASTARLTETLLQKVVLGRDAFSHGAILQSMWHSVRNLGCSGVAMMAIAAIDNALWDLRARLLDIPLVSLLGRVRDSIPVYGSGGFTSYTDDQLTKQFSGWAEQGFTMMKMKVGTDPARDPHRVLAARHAIGDAPKLFVDANGAYTVAQAIRLAKVFSEEAVVAWFEEPVSSDNLIGLNQIRSRVPAGMDVAAGEYGYTAWYFLHMLDAQAVTVLQADATRCGGISGFLDAASLCWAHNVPLSSHCGPSMHLHVCCAAPRAIHMEFFHDHTRIERMFFDGFCEPKDGCMSPDLSRPGMGLELKEKDAAAYRI